MDKMRLGGIAVLLLVGAAGGVPAQERAVAGALDTQMTWSALKGAVDGAEAKSGGANRRVDQVILCGNKSMLYAPGADGADGDGCKADSGTYKGPLITGGQTGADCLMAGGYPTQITGGYVCAFNPNLVNATTGLAGLFGAPASASVCPAGWNPYQNLSKAGVSARCY